MSQVIVVNLPVTDLTRSLLTHDRFAHFTDRAIVDARTHAQLLLALGRESRAAVDTIVGEAVTAGGNADPTPPREMGDMMYGRSFADPDGHIWEVMWMDVEKMMAAPCGEAAAA